MKARASSKVAITGGAIRRSNWHWQVLKVQTSDSSCNRLTLGSAPSNATHYTPPKEPVNGFVQKAALAGLFAAESRVWPFVYLRVPSWIVCHSFSEKRSTKEH